MRMRFCATIRRPAFSISALTAPVRLRSVASGLMIEKVRSIAIFGPQINGLWSWPRLYRWPGRTASARLAATGRRKRPDLRRPRNGRDGHVSEMSDDNAGGDVLRGSFGSYRRHAWPRRGPSRRIRPIWPAPRARHRVPAILQRPAGILWIRALLPARAACYPLGAPLAARQPLL